MLASWNANYGHPITSRLEIQQRINMDTTRWCKSEIIWPINYVSRSASRHAIFTDKQNLFSYRCYSYDIMMNGDFSPLIFKSNFYHHECLSIKRKACAKDQSISILIY